MAKHRSNRGFALATVLIASTVMLTVLVVCVQSTAAIRQSLLGQYYSGLARNAAESGIAYAKACLAANASNPGAPEWSSSKPLQVNTGCDGNVPSSPSSATCVASANTAGCTVASNGDVTSNFSVAYPLLNTDSNSPYYNDAISLESTGIVNVLRTSQVGTSASPWRTYKVTIEADLVTPNLCSPYNTSTTGWSNVNAVSPSTYPISGYTATEITTTATGVDLPGPAYYETNFSVATAGTYTLAELGDDRAEVSIDGVLQVVSTDSVGTASVTLSAGCHTLVAKVTNYGSVASSTGVTIAVRQSGATTDILDTEDADTRWRVTTGAIVDYSQTNFSDDPVSGWSPVRVIASYNAASAWAAPTNWTSLGGDTHANWINSTVTLAGVDQPYSASTAYPAASYMNLRSAQGFTSVGTDPVKLVVACDDQCTVYVDGSQVLSNSSATTASTVTLTNLTAGKHEVAALLYNSTGASGFLFSAYDTSTNTTLIRSDASWESTNGWTSSVVDPQSYDATFVPANLPVAASGATYPSITNLATNPSFETSSSTNTNARSTTLAQSTAFHASGSDSLLVTPNSATVDDSSAGIGLDSGNGMQLGMVAGHEYVLSATVNIPTALSGTLDPNGRIAALSVWYFQTGYNTAIYDMSAPVNVANTYSLSLTFHLPTDATQAYVRLYNGALSGGGGVYWDAVSLVDITNGPVPVAYHDGSSANWAWSGTAGTSTSIGPYTP